MIKKCVKGKKENYNLSARRAAVTLARENENIERIREKR
jgi:hypothetical protein